MKPLLDITVPGIPYPLSDVHVALDLFRRLCGNQSPDSMIFRTIPHIPPSKARPRYTRKGHVYQPPKDRNAEVRTALYLNQMVKAPMQGNVALGCVFYRPNLQRIDTDNMLKHVCDAANGILWADDSQVTAIMGITEYDPAEPRTIIVIGPHLSTLKRGSDNTVPCVVCATPIPSVASGYRSKTCSIECAQTIRGTVSLAEPIPCAQCGKTFRRRTSSQKVCSKECGHLLLVRPKSSRRTLSSCLDCGTTLTHNRGGRCRACWLTFKKRGSQASDATYISVIEAP